MDDASDTFCEERKSESVLRIAVLCTLYAAALLCAVVFSPSMGLVTPNPTGEVGRIASMEQPTRR